VRKLKANGNALRIGTNHGSLSDRIMNRYGDTPQGMVESALEFVRICRDEGYHNLVLSMKSSIPSVMIAAYRLLVRTMVNEGMDYPIHLGVTEAGNGLEGRVKSALGTGSLLATGIGDTIRVSLTEDSRYEIEAARAILEAVEREVAAIRGRAQDPANPPPERDASASSGAIVWIESPLWRDLPASPFVTRRRTRPWRVGALEFGAGAPPRVECALEPGSVGGDFGTTDRPLRTPEGNAELVSIAFDAMHARARPDRAQLAAVRGRVSPIPVLLEWSGAIEVETLARLLPSVDALGLVVPVGPARRTELTQGVVAFLRERSLPIRWRVPHAVDPRAAVAALEATGFLGDDAFLCEWGPGFSSRARSLARALGEGSSVIVLEAPLHGADAAITAGALLLEGVGDGVVLVPGVRPGGPSVEHDWPPGGVEWVVDPVSSAYRLLQACRARLSRAEFIACPSCGRTQFDLQRTTARIRRRTEHLVGVKIAIMGCIVNGPGEMADADFGYVGSGKGKVDLYVGKERVAKSIPESEAEDRLVALIREWGRWVDEPVSLPGS
jgi:(E)-4-hydroxy-3-methylbut-2-enyl-diphosphate synthase